MICIFICIGSPYFYGCEHSRCNSKPESTRGFPAFVIPAAWSTPKYRVFLLSVKLYFRSVLPHSLNLCCLTAWFSCCLTAWIYAASQLDANPDSYLSYWLLRQKPDMCFGIIVSRHWFWDIGSPVLAGYLFWIQMDICTNELVAPAVTGYPVELVFRLQHCICPLLPKCNFISIRVLATDLRPSICTLMPKCGTTTTAPWILILASVNDGFRFD